MLHITVDTVKPSRLSEKAISKHLCSSDLEPNYPAYLRLEPRPMPVTHSSAACTVLCHQDSHCSQPIVEQSSPISRFQLEYVYGQSSSGYRLQCLSPNLLNTLMQKPRALPCTCVHSSIEVLCTMKNSFVLDGNTWC